MSLESAVRCVEAALERNRNCATGLVTQKRVFGIHRGPSGEEEILALLYAEDSYFGYWYGHIVKHPRNAAKFVSLIVWSNKLANAQTVPLLFQRFYYWIKDRLEYHSCVVQNPDDAYQESHSIEEAASNLAKMITRFDLDKRSGDEDGPYANSPPELRTMNVYGLTDTRDEHGCYPDFPMPISLSIVKSPGQSMKYPRLCPK
ncbi:MAG: hypothetical protein Q7T96_07110 [Methylobacter sp.]|nr:hypothetical protein [Methylobacter sp.]